MTFLRRQRLSTEPADRSPRPVDGRVCPVGEPNTGRWADIPRHEILRNLQINERTYRYAIAAFVVLFAIIGLFTVLSDDGPQSRGEVVVVCAILASTLPVGWVMSRINHAELWWSHQRKWSWRSAPDLFVVYADVGLTGVLVTFRDASLAVFGAALFAIISAYAAHFVVTITRIGHVLFSSFVIIGLGVWGVVAGTFDPAGGLARISILLLVVNGTVALNAAYTVEVRGAIVASYRRATTDPLTGVANRRGFLLRAQRLIQRSPSGVIVAFVDIDAFKVINDTRGHHHGDQILIAVANAIRAVAGPEANVGRLGGDEFAIAVANSTANATLASQLQAYVSISSGVSVSVGVTETHRPDPAPRRALAAILSTADENLYAAKNRV